MISLAPNNEIRAPIQHYSIRPVLGGMSEFFKESFYIGPSSRNCLRRHIDEIHKQIKKYECPVCKQGFGRPAAYSLHMSKKHPGYGVSAPMKLVCFVCDVCKEEFKGKITLDVHVERVHSSSHLAHACSQCDRKFPNENELELHCSKFHVKSSENQCHACQRCFQSAKTLQRHIQNVHHQIKKAKRNE